MPLRRASTEGFLSSWKKNKLQNEMENMELK